jgi:hypothetical protein
VERCRSFPSSLDHRLEPYHDDENLGTSVPVFDHDSDQQVLAFAQTNVASFLFPAVTTTLVSSESNVVQIQQQENSCRHYEYEYEY